ncbi:N-acetylglutamate synthase [Prosthecobacter debontii]|uniref:amino-acid N-acetyltransferase n=1 Tax=Prosthecobacter debontii TaxID=48467 RepID=A0A1T4YJ52_9BACT|nr:amino-acid N-acetyltransferase [Prosthecobacter debontii]SKB01730.1 N-acetylglutamate synthase [Prosthecobacter debontii]
MPENDPTKPAPRFEDLRGVLRYVPQFRQRVFVIAIDGALMHQPGFPGLLQDVAVLQSLNIEVVLIFGARAQVRYLAGKRGVTLSNDDGMGQTDAATMEVAIDAITRQTSALMADLTALEMPVAVANALAVHPAGVINGVDQEFTGRIERVDTETLNVLMKADIIPVVPPMGYDSRGTTLRLNSDAVAVEVAIALRAAKVIFVSEAGLTNSEGERLAQISVGDAREMYRRKDPRYDINLLSKLRYAALACQEGVPRVHIVDGNQDEALLSELFSNEGVGTMIHADDYQQIRPAESSDVPALLSMMQQSMDDAALVPRTREQIQSKIHDFFVLELDGNPIGCVAVHDYDEGGKKTGELACLFVRRSHKNRGHGQKLVAFAEETARQRDCEVLVALSTQAFRFFEEKMGFLVTTPDALPTPRREKYNQSGRNSKVLTKPLR